MPRNGSGTYNLPAGNPVTGGTTISSGWANTTLSDLASALTGSLATDGQTVMTGPLKTAPGTSADTALGPTADRTTGFVFGASGATTLYGAGAVRAAFSSGGLRVGELLSTVQQVLTLAQGAGANLSPGLVLSRTDGGVGWFRGVNVNGATILAANPAGYSDLQLNAATKFLLTAGGEVALGSSANPTNYGGGFRTLEVRGSSSTDGGVLRTQTSSAEIAANYLVSNASGGAVLWTTTNHPLILGTNGSEKVRITTDGRLYGTALHNNAGAVTGTTNQYLASGTYTPSVTAVSNCSSPSAQVHQWMRVGNVVHVSGYVSVSVTAGTTSTSFRVALPIASALSTSYQLNGAINVSAATSTLPYISADAANDQALVQFTSGAATGSYIVGYSFQYEVL